MNERSEPDDSTTSGLEGRESYRCPGELYSISRSIHLARLAAFYPKCHDCEHRFETGRALPPDEQQHQAAHRRTVRNTLLTEESVRGVYLNELDRNRALLWGEAIAGYLWDQQPMLARPPRSPSQIVVQKMTAPSGHGIDTPTVVVGFDERPSSPDIVTGLVLGLRRMGCPVVDLGQTSLPRLAFEVCVLQSAAGVFVTGAGCDPSFTGFDFVARHGLPLTQDVLLRLEHLVNTGVGRQTRQIGTHQPVRGTPAYESHFESHFHALRPLRIVCGSSTRLVPRTLNRIFEKLSCELAHVSLAMRQRDLLDVQDVDLQRVANAVVEGRYHLGLVIDDDGRHVMFVTDRGRLVSGREIARLMIEIVQRENPHAQFVVATSWLAEVRRWLQGRQAVAQDGGETSAILVRNLVEHEAAMALAADGRVWFNEGYPACDAILVLGRVLQALSLSDAPFSDVVARLEKPPV